MTGQNIADIITHISLVPIILASIIGNVLALVVKLNRRKKRSFNSGDLLIVNLAICDLNKTWTMYVSWIYSYVIANSWKFGKIWCSVFQKSIVILFSVTSLTLLVLTVERYMLIVKPFNRAFTLRRAQRLLAVVWITAILVNAPPVLFNFDVIAVQGITSCVGAKSSIVIYLIEIIYFIMIIFIPGILIMILSIKAGKRLDRNSKSCTPQMKASKNFNEKMRRNKNAIYTLRSITLGSILCYGPWAFSYILQVMNPSILVEYMDGTAWQPIFVWVIFGGFCNTPMTYLIFSQEFRKEIKEIFNRKRKKTATSSRVTPKTS